MSRILFFKKIHPDAITPTKAHENDACWDLYSVEDVTLKPGNTRAVKTGLIFEILPGEKLHIYSRSGLAAKNSIHVLNAPGVIDAGYVGEICVILHNANHESDFPIPKGSKIAQFSRELVRDDKLVETDIIQMNTKRGEAGFGSSGL